MSAATVLTSSMPGMPALSGTGGSLAALFRHIAPVLGWSIEFDNGIDIIVIRPQSYGDGQALFYRIDDRADRGGLAPRVAEVRAYESMSDINTGAGLVGPVYVCKSYYASTAPQKYYFIGDQYGFVLGTNYYDNTSYFDEAWQPHYLGFLNRSETSDTPVCALMGGLDAAQHNYMMKSGSYSISAYPCMFIHKDRTGTVNRPVAQISTCNLDIPGYAISGRYNESNVSKGLLSYPYYGTALMSRPYVTDGKTGTASGFIPGLYAWHHSGSVGSNMAVAPSVISPYSLGALQLVSGFHPSYGGYNKNNSWVQYDIGEGFRP